MSFVRVAAAVAAKDLRIEGRGRYAAAAVLPFAVTLLLALGLSLGPGRSLLEQVAPGLLWVSIVFASVLASRQGFAIETEDGALERLLLAPVDAAAVFLGKSAASALAVLVLAVVVLALVALLFDLPLARDPGVLAAGLVLGTLGLAAVATLFGVLNALPRARESVFPLLVLPLATPVIVAGVRVSALAAAGRGAEAGSWLGLLLAFDAVFLAAGTLVFGHLLED